MKPKNKKIKIILTSVGTRGDVEPFIAIGEILKKKGHQVICAFPKQFEGLVIESNLEFASLGLKFIELLESKDGKAAMGGATGLKKLIGLVKLAFNQKEVNKELVFKQQEVIEKEQPDRILYNGKTMYPIIWGLNNREKVIFITPLPYGHYVKGHTHIAFNSNLGTFLNKFSFSLANFGVVTMVMKTRKLLKITKKITRKQIRSALLFNKSIYTISPALFSRPDYWSKNLKVLGYHERSKTSNWHPDQALTDFIKNHNKILFITFGSMINPEPEEKTKIILDILERNKIPAIINTASGGLVAPAKFSSELIHFVSQIPYDWIFPKVYAVIHHGGSGTTHMALKYGCASMIIPHIIDQFVWNKIIFNKSVGPKGIKINRITNRKLEPKILDLVNNNDYKKKAEIISNKMKAEDFKEELYNTII